MKKVKFGMRSAYLILASVFLILVNLTLGLVLTNVSQKALIAQIEGRMLDIANTAADMINGDELERLTKNDVETKEFQDVVNTLIGFQSNIQLEYIYCIQDLGNKQFAFSVDPTVDDPGGFGDPVVYTDALYQASLGKASVDKVPYEDSWGRFYSAYSPVINSKGKVAGIVAVDFSAEWYDNTVSTQARIILIICGLSLLAGGLIVIILTEHSRRRNHKLYAQLNALADNVEDLVREVGNTTHTEQYLRTHTIHTDSGDGIRDLNQKIQSMQEDLRMEIASVHRMAFIDAPWASPRQDERRALGTFRETWTIAWKPEFDVVIVDASKYGATLLEAASNMAVAELDKKQTLADVMELVERALPAELNDDALERVFRRLRNDAAVSSDVNFSVSAMLRAAPSPCTCTGKMRMSTSSFFDLMILMISLTAAPVEDVRIPIL